MTTGQDEDKNIYRQKKIKFKLIGIGKKSKRKVYKKVVEYTDTFMPRIKASQNVFYENLLLESLTQNLQ